MVKIVMAGWIRLWVALSLAMLIGVTAVYFEDYPSKLAMLEVEKIAHPPGGVFGPSAPALARMCQKKSDSQNDRDHAVVLVECLDNGHYGERIERDRDEKIRIDNENEKYVENNILSVQGAFIAMVLGIWLGLATALLVVFTIVRWVARGFHEDLKS